MDSILKNKITTILQSPKTLEIINTPTFYFQKAKDVLQDFLQLEVSDEIKTFLLSNRKEYNELKQLFEDGNDLEVFGKLILSIIAYCDMNAHNKRLLNEYEDNRVLALAFVRMNHWVEQLITYKFERQLSEGSVKNAIEYLLYPIDNFTMLSENHRNQISQNLFNKQYDKATFKDNFSKFFLEFSIAVKNPENFTHILSRIAYGIELDWKESIIGLVSPDGTGWQEEAISKTKNGNYIALWNHKKPNGTAKTLKLLRQQIDENDFFKIYYTSNHTAYYVAEIVDFITSQDELNKAKWSEKYKDIIWYSDDFSGYKNDNMSANWVYLARKIYKIEPILSSNFNYHKSFGYPSVGCQAPINSLITSSEIEKQKLMNNNINILKYKKQIILQGPPGTGKTREAKLIALGMLGLNDVDDLKNNDQFKLIQFHPSYTYEDFVRGIVAKPNPAGEGIVYEAENKTLGAFAKEALKNYKASSDTSVESNIEIWIDSAFEDFKTEIEKEIEEKEIKLSGDITLFKVESDSFRYGKNWNNPSRINFNDLKNLIKAVIHNRLTLSNQQMAKEFSVHAHHRYTYYNAVLKIFFDKYSYKGESFSEPTKSYVLIIDEINRANLSSVLGELIYALEYRGEAVESMYTVDGNNRLILPPNLYIIGTMNTADRSVGHIDYAIRRRFAFVDVLAENLKENQGLTEFDEYLFNEVADLFNNNLSPEFEKNDVQLGHSYFIDKSKEKDGVTMAIRLKYEIKPILLEYVKDGVLIGENIKTKIEDLKPSI